MCQYITKTDDISLQELIDEARTQALEEARMAREERDRKLQEALSRIQRDFTARQEIATRRSEARILGRQAEKERILRNTYLLFEKHDRAREQLRASQDRRRAEYPRIDAELEEKRRAAAVLHEEAQRQEISRKVAEQIAEEDAREERSRQRKKRRLEIEKAARQKSEAARINAEARSREIALQMEANERYFENIVDSRGLTGSKKMRAISELRSAFYKTISELTRPRTLNLTEDDLREMGFEPIEETKQPAVTLTKRENLDPSIIISDPELQLDISEEEAARIADAFAEKTTVWHSEKKDNDE